MKKANVKSYILQHHSRLCSIVPSLKAVYQQPLAAFVLFHCSDIFVLLTDAFVFGY